MFGNGVKREEYDKVVKANKELRMKMEKLRLENALLKDQVRALQKLPRNLSELYVFIQSNDSVTMDDLSNAFSMAEEELEGCLKELIEKGIVEKRDDRGTERFSIRVPDLSGV
jgi:predicted transcriptional regulator